MNFIKRIINNLVKSTTEREWSLMNGSTALEKSSDPVQLYKNWTYVAIDKIAETLSGITLYLEDNKGNRIDNHPLLNLLRKPNPESTESDLIYSIGANLEIFGNYYTIAGQGELTPKTLYPIEQNKVTLKLNNDPVRRELEAYLINGRPYAPNEIIHFKYTSPFNRFIGEGTVSRILSWLVSESEATRLRNQFFKNGGLLHGIIETDTEIADQLTLIKRGFESNYIGQGKEFQTAVLPKGASYKAISSLKDIQLSEDDTNIRDKILAAFGVPKSVLGITESGSSKADAEAKNFAFLSITIEPKMKRIVANINSFLLPKFPNSDKLKLKYEDPKPEDAETKREERKVALAGQAYKSINEVRSEDGLDPIENGDSVLVTGFPSPLGATQKEKKMTPEPFKKLAKKIVEIKKKNNKGKYELSDEAMEAEHKQFIVSVTTFEKEYIKRLLTVSEKYNKIAIETLNKKSKSIEETEIAVGFTSKEYSEAIINATAPVLQELLQKEGNQAMARITTNPFNPLNEELQDQLREYVSLSTESYGDTTIKLLEKELSEGVAKGETLKELTERVDGVFDLDTLYRAEAIARDTVFGTANAAGRAAYVQSGVVKTVRWHTAEDELVCPQCEPMNGKTISVEKKWFNIGDTYTDANGKVVDVSYRDIGTPPLHSRCRCFELPDEISID